MRPTIVALGLLLAAGCGAERSASPPATSPPESRPAVLDDQYTGGQGTVSVGGDTEGEVRVLAVVTDLEGQTETHDLGAYAGPVRELPPGPGEVMRIEVSDGTQIGFVEREGRLEARRGQLHPGAISDEELLLRIPMPEDVSIETEPLDPE